MGKKKTPQPIPKNAGSEPFHSPFAALGGLRAKLPAAEPTGTGEAEPTDAADVAPDTGAWLSQKLVVRHERKGHGGKTVTRLEGVRGEVERQELARRLAKALGCGTRVDAEAVVLSGDLRTRLLVWLQAQGARRVVTGS